MATQRPVGHLVRASSGFANVDVWRPADVAVWLVHAKKRNVVIADWDRALWRLRTYRDDTGSIRMHRNPLADIG